MANTHALSCRTWSGNPFTVEVRRSGQLGFLERGAEDHVPRDLVRLAVSMWAAGVAECKFVWMPGAGEPGCRVALALRPCGSYEYVELQGDPVTELPHGLSTRELEVLTLLVTGQSNAGIAEALWISSGTAAVHVNHLLQKLQLPTRTAAAAYAVDTGLIHLPLPGELAHYAPLTIGKLVTAAERLPAAHNDRRRQIGTQARPLTPRRTRSRDLVVGAVLPTVGKGSDDGIEMGNGLQLAVEEINAAGGVRGRKLKAAVSPADVTCSASIRAAFELLLNKGVDVLTSGYLADQEVAHELAAASGIPYLHAATSATMEDAVRQDIDRFGHVFQVCASDTTYAPTFVSYLTHLRDQGLWASPSQRLVVIKKDWRHVQFGIDRAQVLADENNWQLDIINVAGPENGDGWVRAVSQALKEPAAAAMIGSYFTCDTVQAIEALRMANAPTLAYATYAPSVPGFRHQLGDAAEGVLWATMTGTYSDSTGIAFARRYEHRFGVAPGRSHAGLAYDRVQRIALAWRLSDDLADHDEIAGNIRSQPYRGVNGTYNFNTPGQAALGFEGEHGDPSLAQPQLVFQIQDGKHVIVDGGPFRTGKFRLAERDLAALRG